MGRLPVGRRATFESTKPQQQGSDACRRRVTRSRERRREQRGGRAGELAPKAIWGWILLALGLWGVLQVGAALVLKGSRERVEVFTFDALRCDNSYALGRHSGRRACGEERIKGGNGMPSRVPAGELGVLQLERGTRFQATLCKKKKSTMRAVCGSSWHSNLNEPVDIWKPNRLSRTECGRIGAPLVPTGEREGQIRVLKGPRPMH